MSQTARNLTKNELGAVIFGCKHHTIKECLLKQMFGLPASHYSYVKNVTPGLPLFLFNYSDRKLHGIFEAASPGQMNINTYAWITSEGAEITPYAAQVRVNVRRQCRPLLEKEFKPIIAKNYYAERLFWFELDKEQTSRLTKIFLPSPLPEKMPRAPSAVQWNNMFDSLSNSDINEDADEDFNNLDSQEFSEMAETKLTDNDHLYASVVVNKGAFAPEKKWTELFKTSPPSSVVESHERSESHEVILDSSVSDQFDMEWEFASSSHKMNNLHPESCKDAANTKYDSYVVDCWEQHALMNSDATKIYENKLSCLQYHEQDSDRPADLKDGTSSQSRTSLDGKDGELKPLELESVVAKRPGEDLLDTKEEVRSCNPLAPKEKCESDHTVPNLTNKVFHENNNAMVGEVLMDIQPSDFESVIIKLMREIEWLKDYQLKQMLKVDSLEHELSQSKLELDQLKKHCHKLESVPFFANNHSDIQHCESSNFTAEESVLILGGFDGRSWLSELSLYSLSENHFKSLCPMTFSRAHASVAKLNGELYIFGGVHDGLWSDTVESYNPMSNQWVKQPSLNQKKGSLAGVSIYNKFLQLVGEMELNVSPTWNYLIYTLEDGSPVNLCLKRNEPEAVYVLFSLQRFGPAAADMNGAIYVAGGYDGKDYLRSVERFDVREHAWTRIGSMNTKRGCHSLVAFQEKMYALGGYDGDKMVSSVEVFEPRVGSWMMEEPMQVAKGYFGSFVLGEKIYAIGGCLQEMGVLDVIESYAEGCGWQVAGRTALGKRCFFSSIVL
ncbi:UNVERIFIED_CONTAM: B2 protein [Sesamum latifolium]|uniref:B2 protein n=1 Tax=Sesamum latifolium TaxID=2727402 RepID=A0AAW2T961_9LAMI